MKNNTTKRMMAFLLSLTVMLSLVVVPVGATETPDETAGQGSSKTELSTAYVVKKDTALLLNTSTGNIPTPVTVDMLNLDYGIDNPFSNEGLSRFTWEGVSVESGAGTDNVKISYFQADDSYSTDFSAAMNYGWRQNEDGSYSANDMLGVSCAHAAMGYRFVGSGTVSFAYSLHTEEYNEFSLNESDTGLWDCFAVIADDHVIVQQGGIIDNGTFSYTFEGNGVHYIAWLYVKDPGGDTDGEYCTVSNITTTAAANIYQITNENPCISYTENGVKKTASFTNGHFTFPYEGVTDAVFNYVPQDDVTYTLTVNGVEVRDSNVTLNYKADNVISLEAAHPKEGFATWSVSTTCNITWNELVTVNSPDAQYSFTTSEDAPWRFDFGFTNQDGIIAKSGSMGYNDAPLATALEMKVTAPAGGVYLTFDSTWANYNEPEELAGNSRYVILMDNTPNEEQEYNESCTLKARSGHNSVTDQNDLPWYNDCIFVPEGTHTITWLYVHTYYGGSAERNNGLDGVWIKNLQFRTEKPVGTLTVSYNENAGTVEAMVAQHIDELYNTKFTTSGNDLGCSESDATEVENGAVFSGDAGSRVYLKATPKAGCDFLGFFINDVMVQESGSLKYGDDYMALMNENGVTIEARFTKPEGYDPAEMPAIDGLTFDLLVSEESETQRSFASVKLNNGFTAFRSMNQGIDSSCSLMAVTADEFCTVSFQYKVDSEANYDKFAYAVGKKITSVEEDADEEFSGTAEGTVTLNLEKGQTLYLCYSKDSSGDVGEDQVLLWDFSCIRITEEPAKLTVIYDDSLGFVRIDGKVLASNTSCSVLRGAECQLEAVCLAGFDGWHDNDEHCVSVDKNYTFTLEGETTLAVRFQSPDLTGTNLRSISVFPNYAWTLQEDGSFIPGNVGVDDSYSNLMVESSTSGLLSFQYKTSSEANYDYLIYSKTGPISAQNEDSAANRGSVADFSGERDWITVKIPINAGDKIYFAYRKDGSNANGSDCVWLKDLKVVDGTVNINAGSSNVEYGTVSGNTGELAIGSTVTLTATPMEGYAFYGWRVGNETVSLDTTYTFTATENIHLTAFFASADSMEARIGMTYYNTIGMAFEAGDTVILAKDVVLDSDLTIPTGKTLIIPFSASDETGYQEGIAGCARPTIATRSAFRKLTVEEGKTLTVNGTIVVGGVQHAPDQNAQGQTSGDYAEIVCKGTVQVAAGGTLTVHGKISGSGTTRVANGATAKIPYLVTDYAGGTNTDDLYGAKSFPFGQYATINVQNTMVVEGGASVIGMTSLYFWSSVHTQDIDLIGTNSGLIYLPVGSTLTAVYNADAAVKQKVGNIDLQDFGKTTLTISGGATGGKFSLSGYGSTGMYLNVPYTYDLVLENGIYALADFYRIMPGAAATVSNDATLNVTGGLQVVDGWQQAEKSGKTYPASNVLKDNGFSQSGNLIVNGKLNITGTFGGIVQTSGRGVITTSTGAKLNESLTSGSTGGYSDNLVSYSLPARIMMGDTLTQMTADNEYRATNGETWALQSYTMQANGINGDTVSINQPMQGKWSGKVTLTFDEGEAITAFPGETITLPVPAAKAGYTFAGWYNGEVRFEGTTMPEQNITLTAKWTAKTNTAYTVKHYYETLTDDQFAEPEAETLYGTTAGQTAAAAKSKAGFTVREITQTTIAADGSSVVDIYYDRNSYQLTWDANGGELTSTGHTDGQVKFGTVITKPGAAPTMTGYTFDKWDKYTDNMTMPAENLTITAQWKAKTYTVTFNAGEGVAVSPASKEVTYGDTYGELPIPERTGYTFVGWFDGDTLIEADAKITITANQTLTAKWSANKYKVYFNTDGGTCETESKEVTYGNAYGTLPTPTKNGYIFTGWYDGETKVEDTTPYITAGNTTLTAHWSVVAYTIVYYVNGNQVAKQVYNYGANITPYSYTRLGYTVSAWLQENAEALPDVMPDHDLMVYATTEVITYSITYELSGGEGANNPAYYTVESGDITLNIPTKAGYSFLGWTTSADSTPKKEVTIAKGSIGDRVYVATWQINSHKVIYQVDGEVKYTVTVEYDMPVTVRGTETKTGYTFSGWTVNGAAVVNGQFAMPDKDVVISGSFIANDYTVHFDANGGEGTMNDQGFTYDAAQKLTVNNFVRTGYTFEGWNTAADGNGTACADEAEVKNLTTGNGATVILYAQWTINQYTITFDTDGGTAIETITQDYGTPITAPAAPTKAGYTFNGWDKEIPTTMPAEDMTIKVKWISYLDELYKISDYEDNNLIAARNYFALLNDTQRQEFKESAKWNDFEAAVKSTSFVTLEKAVSDAVVPTNDLLTDNNGAIAILSLTGHQVDARFIQENYPAAQLQSKPFLTKLFGYSEIKSVQIGDQPVYVLTGNESADQTELMLLVAAAANVQLGSAAETYVSILDGKSTTVMLNAETIEGIAYSVTYQIDFFNNTHTVNWDANGGTLNGNSTESVAYGESIKSPIPTREGYGFIGWTPDVEATMGKTDLSYKAQWAPKTYTVSFDAIGGSTCDSISVTYGSTYGNLPIPTRSGYGFDGWFTAQEGGAQVNGTDVVVITDNQTLYAHWTLGAYTISYDYDGGTADNKYSYTVETDGFTLSNPTKTGYTFIGWSGTGLTGESNMTVTISKGSTDDRAYRAHWKINQYTITFNTDGGTAIDAITQDYNTAISVPADPTKTGHTFAGWDKTIPTTMPAENMTIKAQWTINQYTIMFDTDGGSNIPAITQDYATAITEPAAPTRTGYTFNGWDKEIPTTMPAENMTITASWAINRYTITFNTDGGSEVAAITLDYGAAITAPTNPVRTGYTFNGWDMSIPATMPAENMIIKAQWTANTYEVTFNANGGVCGTTSKEVTYDSTYGELPAPTKEGYTFVGWYIGETPVTDATVVTIAADQTLTARWNAKGDTAYVVEYYQQNLSDDGYTKVNAKSMTGQTDATVQAEIPGYTGFVVNREKSTTSGTVAADGNLVLKVYYDRNTYEITWVIDGAETKEIYRFEATPTAPAAVKGEDSHGFYTFIGWDKEIAVVTENASYTAQFVKRYDASIGNTTYRTVELALAAAKSGETVTVQDGAVITENAEVPAGVLLLIPCTEMDTGYSQTAGKERYNPDGTSTTPALGANGTRYCTVTVDEGVTLTVRGTLLVNAVTGRPGAGHIDQDVNGGYAELQLNGNIVVEQGGIFDSCGYTKGNGRVTANAGGTVRDLYVVRNWRGGSHALVMYENKIYPMNEYDMHNITAPIRIYAGAVLEGTVKMYAGEIFSYTRFMQIGDSNGLIRLAGGAYADRTYANGREMYTIYGGADFSSSNMKISGVTVTTADYYFPVDGDIDLVLKNGQYTAHNDFKLLTGSTLTVDDATLTVEDGAKLIAYQEFHDPTNTGNSQYPERPAAEILLTNGARLNVNGGFAGKLKLGTAEGDKAIISIAEDAVTTLSSRETNGYQNPRTNPIYQEITESAALEGIALTSGKILAVIRQDGKIIEIHEWNSGEIIKQATYEESGEKIFTCNVCGEQKTVAIPKLVNGGGGAGGAGGGGAVPTEPEKTETITDPDGTTTKTETKPDGSTVETVTKPDGSTTVTESKTETKPDGSTTTTETKSETKADGSTTETKSETTTAADGSKTETKSESKTEADGAKSETETKTETKPDGSTVETKSETSTAADGSKTESKTETTTAADGSKTETKSETKVEADGTKSETKAETKTDANGVISGTETTQTTTPTGSTGTTTTTTENGNSKTEAEAKISEKAVEEAKQSGEAVKVPTEVKAGEGSGSAPTVKVELPENAGEMKIEIPVSDVNSGTVAVIVHEDGTEEIVKSSTTTENGLQLKVDGSATIKVIDNSKDFIDTRNHWSRDEVNFVASRELFNGIGDNLFGVSGDMTRGMVNTVLARLAGEDTNGGVNWYDKGTEWAKQNGISDGTNPTMNVTREQLAAMLYRFAGSPKVSGKLSFVDAEHVSDYAKSALLWAVQNGILNGVGDNLVAPKNSAERAQVAAMMARYLKNVG